MLNTYRPFERLAMMIVLAYGTRAFTVSAPKDLGLTPVTTTVKRCVRRDLSRQSRDHVLFFPLICSFRAVAASSAVVRLLKVMSMKRSSRRSGISYARCEVKMVKQYARLA